MNFSNVIQNLNWLAIISAAISTFLIGGIWYTIFKNSWMSVNGFTEQDLGKRKMPKVFLLSLFFSLIMSLNLAMFIGNGDLTFGAIAGLLTGLGWVSLSIGIIALFENRSWKYILINGGYMTLAFTIMGIILGGWKK
ncbi:MAG: hypothetical protein RLZZ196_3510 [Bacteroidota bacterium]|jgi:ABC-type Co2+ transport system permease subunit